MGKITAVANQKGGVGKTTSAINIAASLAAAEKRVLLIDADPQGNSTSGLGLDKNSSDGSLYDLYIGRKSLDDIIQATSLENLKIIPSNIELIGAELELSTKRRQRDYIKERYWTCKKQI